MLHRETLEPGTLALIQRLSADPALKDFALVGGTALALQLGHRISVDIDMFSPMAFDSKALRGHLEREYAAERVGSSLHTVQGMLEKIKAMFLAHRYPWVDPLLEVDGVRMASPRDIGAMKLNAIINTDGKRLKDFVDLHVILEHHNLDSILDAFSRKYSENHPEIAKIVLNDRKNRLDSKVHFLGHKFSMEDMARRLKEALQNPRKIFGQIKSDDVAHRHSRNIEEYRRRNRGRKP